jgi:hypothetical protein
MIEPAHRHRRVGRSLDPLIRASQPPLHWRVAMLSRRAALIRQRAALARARQQEAQRTSAIRVAPLDGPGGIIDLGPLRTCAGWNDERDRTWWVLPDGRSLVRILDDDRWIQSGIDWRSLFESFGEPAPAHAEVFPSELTEKDAAELLTHHGYPLPDRLRGRILVEPGEASTGECRRTQGDSPLDGGNVRPHPVELHHTTNDRGETTADTSTAGTRARDSESNTPDVAETAASPIGEAKGKGLADQPKSVDDPIRTAAIPSQAAQPTEGTTPSTAGLSLDDLTPTAWKLLKAIRDLKAVDSETCAIQSRIAAKAKTGNHDSKHNQLAFGQLSGLHLISAKRRVGTWITGAGLQALGKRSKTG